MQKLFDFLNGSPTPFHSVQNIKCDLMKNGFQELKEINKWNLKDGNSYFVIRDESSIIAFNYSNILNGLKIISAHTDSPCLMLKPNPIFRKEELMQFSIEIYGGAIWHSWLDRDLSLAGRILFGQNQSVLIDFKRSIASIPSLAIHLNREVNRSLSLNPQVHLSPIFSEKKIDFSGMIKDKLNNQSIDVDKVYGFDLYFYDINKANFVGLNQEFFSSSRLDNLLSCFAAKEAICNATHNASMLICTNHEEVGSESSVGAGGSFVDDVLNRIFINKDEKIQILQKSYLISADNSHAVHPNYSEKHDMHHSPKINQGIVIKVNNNQRYATTGKTLAFFQEMCEEFNIPTQKFSVRSDITCGSTIGPILSGKLGIPTIDIGVPTLAMHSIREFAGVKDIEYMINIFQKFYAK